MIPRTKTELPAGLTLDDLPLWMRKTRREIDWAFLGMVVVALVIVWPLFARSGLPHNLETQAELARTIEVAESIQAGTLYPRWAPDFNYGYGSPLWNYLAPLPHYLAGLHYVLAQSNPETSVKLVLAFSLGLGGLGLFSFVRRRWGTYAGILAACVYLYSPQIALVKPYLESDLAALMAMGFFVMTLWAFDRVLVSVHGWDISLAASLVAALWLSDTPLSVILIAVAAGWLAWRFFTRDHVLYRWGSAAAALGLGTAFSACYWLPAWAEFSAVRWLPVSQYPLENWHQLMPLDLLAQPDLLDSSAVNPLPTGAVGVAVWLLALAGVIVVALSIWRRTPRDPRSISRGDAFQWRLVHAIRGISHREWEVAYFGLVGIGVFVLVTPAGRPFWDRMPEWPPVYPRDVLPLIAACGAIVAAQLGAVLERARQSLVGVGGMVLILALILGLALPTLSLPAWPATHDMPQLSTVLRDETRGHLVASSIAGWLLPKTVIDVPQPSPALVMSYQNGAIDKVARSELPAAAQVDIVDNAPQSTRLVVKTPYPIELALQILDFKGWRAQVNNRPIPIQTQAKTGFVALELPAGQQEVTVEFGSTPVRDVAWAFTGVALLVMVIISLRLEYELLDERSTQAAAWKLTPEKVTYLQALLLFLIILFGIGGALPRLAPELFTRHSPLGVVLPARTQLPRALSGVDLLAYDVQAGAAVSPGDPVTLHLYWRAVRPDLPDYQANVLLVATGDPERQIMLAQHRHPGSIPVSQWPTWPLFGSYVRDSYYLQLDKNVPPGEYNIVVQLGRCAQQNLFPCQQIEPLFVRDNRGSSLGQQIVLPTPIRVVP